MESLQSAIAQHRIAIIGVHCGIQQRAATGNRWARPVNKIRDELLKLVDAVWDSIKIAHPRV